MVLPFNGFDWDFGNYTKSYIKHRVNFFEAEEVILNEPLVFQDHKHSQTEIRYLAFGKTKNNKHLLVVFTIRMKAGKKHIRIISARPMSQKERNLYEKKLSQN